MNVSGKGPSGQTDSVQYHYIDVITIYNDDEDHPAFLPYSGEDSTPFKRTAA